MPSIRAGTTQVKIRNIDNITVYWRIIGDESSLTITSGDKIEQGATLVMSQGSSISVANGAKVSTSEKFNVSWTQIGSNLTDMNGMYWLTVRDNLVNIIISSIVVTLIGGKTIAISSPIINCTRIVKTNDIIRYAFSVEKNDDNIDSVVTYT
jgi:hypothetical protein